MKVKTADLSGDRLDYFTALAIGEKNPQICLGGGCVVSNGHTVHRFYPSSEWQHGGPLIAEYQIFIDPPHEVHKSMVTADGKQKGCWESYDNWHATISTRVAEKPVNHLWADFSLPGGPYRGEGETPLIAICRAVVASKLGDEVDIPDELMEVGE